jgi:hypothetical protein
MSSPTTLEFPHSYESQQVPANVYATLELPTGEFPVFDLSLLAALAVRLRLLDDIDATIAFHVVRLRPRCRAIPFS